jgi:hypothetical protein
MTKPRYIDPAYIHPDDDEPLGLSVKPPFAFQGVTCRVFPLRANIARLTQFCNDYINMDIPSDIVYFRPALPYVYLMVLNYGSMASSSTHAQNFGWVAQNEVAFFVPVERWHRDKITGKPVFEDWVNVAPFIFVDSQMSLATGREVYGWPKVLAHVEADIPLWTASPRSPLRLFKLSVPLFRDVYAGEAETPQVLIRIDCDPSPTFAQFPLDIRNPWSPLAALPMAVRNSLALAGDAVDWLLGLRVRGFITNRDSNSLLKMGLKAGSYITRLMPEMLYPSSWDQRDVDCTEEERGRKPPVPRLFTASITLKQFRDPDDPSCACYQALVSSRMGINRVNKCGLLGDLSLLGGDPSGGYTIRINRYAEQPIIESLGIVVDATEQETYGGGVAILKPVLPSWVDVDLFYDTGKVICSRTNLSGDNRSSWVAEPRDGLKRPNDSEPVLRATNESNNDTNGSLILYNTAQGAATQPVTGPFHFPDVTMQVYPLLADRSTLDHFLDRYMNDPLKGSQCCFKTLGSYVYLVVSVCGHQHGAMWSDSNNIGRWAEREVTFCVPVKWYDGEKLVSVGMIEPFVYANNDRAVTTDREISGRPSVKATIDSPKDAWLSPKGPGEHRQFLRMEIEMFPALGLGQKAQLGTLLEIDERDVPADGDTAGWTHVTETWGPEVLADLRRKANLASAPETKRLMENANVLALEILAHSAPINRISLKQYRDAQDVEKACYQALVNTKRSITHIYDIREILHSRNLVHVRLHRIAGHPIVDVLGLKTKRVESANGNVVNIIQPLRPFWMHVGVKEQLGKVICTFDTRSSTQDISADSPSYPNSKRDCEIVNPWITGASDISENGSSCGNDSFMRVGRAVLYPDSGKMFWDRDVMKEMKTLRTFFPSPIRTDLKQQAQDWLRKSLTYELAWIKSSLESDPWEELGTNFDPSDSDNLTRLMTTHSVASYCAGASIESLMDLVVAIVNGRRGILDDMDANEEDGKASDPDTKTSDLEKSLDHLRQLLVQWFDRTTKDISDHPSEWTKDWTNNLQEHQKQVLGRLDECNVLLQEFSNKKRAALELSTDIGLRLKTLLDNARFYRGRLGWTIGEVGGLGSMNYKEAAYQALVDNNKMLLEGLGDYSGDPNAITEAYTIVEEVWRVATDWTHIELFRRLGRKETAECIRNLEELQLVFESILSKGWENWSQDWTNWQDQQRRDHQDRFESRWPREPDQRIPIGSVTDDWIEKHGLEKSVDKRFGTSWVVPLDRFKIPEGLDKIPEALE